MAAATRKRIYLAGPEVFLVDGLAVGAAKAALAARYGFEGLFPLDQQLGLDGLSRREMARAIALANEGLMRTCDLLIANLTPFRGVAMDSGTAFEVGFMRALGRPVLGYINIPGDYRGRAEAFRARGIPLGDCDRDDAEIEDFGLPENLMIAIAILESGGTVFEGNARRGHEMADVAAFERCLAEAQRLFGA